MTLEVIGMPKTRTDFRRSVACELEGLGHECEVKPESCPDAFVVSGVPIDLHVSFAYMHRYYPGTTDQVIGFHVYVAGIKVCRGIQDPGRAAKAVAEHIVNTFDRHRNEHDRRVSNDAKDAFDAAWRVRVQGAGWNEYSRYYNGVASLARPILMIRHRRPETEEEQAVLGDWMKKRYAELTEQLGAEVAALGFAPVPEEKT